MAFEFLLFLNTYENRLSLVVTDMKTTALSAWHEKAGAKMIDFGGYLMPVRYAGILAEHKAVRSAAGLFDVSHMGNFFVSGGGALEFLQAMTTNDLSVVEDGQAQYTLLLYPNGGIVDDLIIYRMSGEQFFLIVNASNAEKDFAWLQDHLGDFDDVVLEDHTDRLSLIALQGPRSLEVLCAVFGWSGSDVPDQFRFRKADFEGVGVLVARTGYTGEKGVEISVPNDSVVALWEALMAAGSACGIQPIGLGARDTLRLEMGYSLYGHEIDAETNPLEARLKWVVKLQKERFIGKEACVQVESNLKRGVAGFSLDGRVLPRQHCRVFNTDRQEIGWVCSGTLSPTLQEPVGTCSVLLPYVKLGTPLFVEVRGALHPGRIRSLPFIKQG